MLEIQLVTNTVGGAAPYLVYRVERVSDFVETVLNAQICSSISADDADSKIRALMEDSPSQSGPGIC